MRYDGIDGRVAIVTGANHGIGAATSVALAGSGARVLVSYLRVDDGAEDGPPEAYRVNRARDASGVVRAIAHAGGRAEAVEADLRRPRHAREAVRCRGSRLSGTSRSSSTTRPAARRHVQAGRAGPARSTARAPFGRDRDRH